MKGWFKASRQHLALLIASTMVVVSACSSGGGSETVNSNTGNEKPTATSTTSGGDSGQAEQEPLAIKLMYNFDGVEFPKEGNDVQKYIEQATNTKLTVSALPGSSYEERLPIMIASDDMPDAFPIPRRHQKLPYVVNAVQAGLFWEIGPYLEQFPNLSAINPVIYENIAYEGKTYGLPRERALARRAIQFRSDWLANVGMETPKTIDDFYNMLVAFKNNDPDQNGQADTTGMTAKEVGLWFAPYFGAPNQWKMEDGKFIRDVQTEEFLNALKFEKKLYDEGLMNKDFAVIERPEWTGAAENGKAGVRIDVTGSTVGLDSVVKENLGEHAAFSMISILEGDYGKRINMEGGHNGFFLFPKSSIKTEEHLLRLLKFFDDLAGETISNLFVWGLEGVHYEMKDGKPVAIPDNKHGDDVGAPYGAPLSTLAPAINAMQGELSELGQLEQKLNAENAEFGIVDPTLPLISETFLEQGAQLETILSDANIKFVMGSITEEQWRGEVERWLKSGGSKIAQEYEEAQAKLNK